MATMEYLEQVYNVPIVAEKGNEHSDSETLNEEQHSYILRGLNEEEVRPWSEFCASVFSYKVNPPPAEYFYRHYANDPSKGSSKLIRVALYNGNIVSSCRIFLRTISSGKGRGALGLRAGGIGEVCTAVEHRRRGISLALLKSTIPIMRERGLEVSSLHAAPVFFPLYESMGYSPTTSGNQWSSVVMTKTSTLANGNDNAPVMQESDRCVVRQARFPGDTEALQKLHAQYSEERLAGCLTRSKDYWTRYLSQELEGSLFVLTTGPAARSENATKDTNGETILAWLSLQQSNSSSPNREEGFPCFQLKEFGRNLSAAPPGGCAIPTGLALGTLVAHAAVASKPFSDQPFRGASNTATAAGGTTDELTVRLKMPRFVRNEIRSDDKTEDAGTTNGVFRFDWESERTENDNGWMYRSLVSQPKADGEETKSCDVSDFLELVCGQGSNHKAIANQKLPEEHFVWPSDSF